jgi:hypothetical protein
MTDGKELDGVAPCGVAFGLSVQDAERRFTVEVHLLQT